MVLDVESERFVTKVNADRLPRMLQSNGRIQVDSFADVFEYIPCDQNE